MKKLCELHRLEQSRCMANFDMYMRRGQFASEHIPNLAIVIEVVSRCFIETARVSSQRIQIGVVDRKEPHEA